MTTSDGNQNWLALYREAVLEPDRKKLRIRVVQAQTAIRQRTLELWYAGAPPAVEQRQMDAASQLLGILRTVRAEKW